MRRKLPTVLLAAVIQTVGLGLGLSQGYQPALQSSSQGTSAQPWTQIGAQQDNRPAQPQVLKLNVLVTNEAADPISDLKQEEFLVFENNVLQNISSFSNEELPLIYAIVVDNSASFKNVLEDALSAIRIVIENNKPADETMLVRFVDSKRIETVRDLTTDRKELLKPLQNFQFFYIEGGQSAVVDAVYLTAQRISQYKKNDGANRRRALILMSDGEDRRSYYKKEHLIELLRTEDIQIFVIGFVGDLEGWRNGSTWGTPREKATNLLNSLAKESGGPAVFPKSPAELTAVAKQFSIYLRSQYTIGYVPTTQPSAKPYRKLSVKLVDSLERKRLSVTTRSGYMALPR